MRIKSWIEKNKKSIFLFIFVAFVYSSFYDVYPARPGAHLPVPQPSLGWELWADQGEYYEMSTAIANGSFSSENFVYGLGYPILGVPFVWMGSEDSVFSHHRFFIPNLILLFAVVYMTYNLTYRITENTTISVISIMSLLFLTLYLQWFIEPWNLHVADVGILGIFYIFFRKPELISKRQLIVAALLVGWIFSTRYLDVFWLLPIFTVYLIFNIKKIVYFIPGVLVIMLVLTSHVVYFDDPFELPHVYRTVYPDNVHPAFNGVPFDLYEWDLTYISMRLYCISFDPMYCLPEKTGDSIVDDAWYYSLWDKTPILASSSAFLAISPLGIFLLLRKYSSQQRLILVALLVGFIAAMISYTATAWFASGWTRFFRYEMFWFPLFTIFSVYGIMFLYYKIKSKKIKSL